MTLPQMTEVGGEMGYTLHPLRRQRAMRIAGLVNRITISPRARMRSFHRETPGQIPSAGNACRASQGSQTVNQMMQSTPNILRPRGFRVGM